MKNPERRKVFGFLLYIKSAGNKSRRNKTGFDFRERMQIQVSPLQRLMEMENHQPLSSLMIQTDHTKYPYG